MIAVASSSLIASTAFAATTCEYGNYYDYQQETCVSYVPSFNGDNIALPDVSLEGGIGVAIRTIFGWSILIALVAIVYAGVLLLLARGNEEEAAKAKKTITYLIVGMLIMAGAYGIVAGVSQFNFFN
ncbi:hypothetical protein CVV38_04215 [Candidatus Peregrinibacteria bacterium HGW-Peregrinibacteria-1]|nr:MAG: hypothetical protein CVV38_04215 [Candidatus Peregrinibacteria bacterium HGW-Peregrinibacteria-1]